MSARIRYSAVPLYELIGELSESSAHKDCSFLRRVSERIGKGETVQEAWVCVSKTAPFFSETDREILTDIGSRLGGSDTDGQLSMLALAEDMLSRSLEEAERESSRKAHTLLGVWTLCGIGAGMIII